ncbi:MAG: archaemetzincin family Zn-dependent metalloprotease [Chloroflexota bacterium]
MALKAIRLRPLGRVGPDYVLERLARDVGEVFGVECQVNPALPLSDDALNPARRQYSSPWLLSHLRAVGAAEGTAVLGVVDEDLYVEGLNFVFGQAELPGQWAVISLCRLRGQGVDAAETLYQRALKEAVHEIGHTVGLGHCPDPACVMHFSNTLADTDRKGHLPCTACQLKGW